MYFYPGLYQSFLFAWDFSLDPVSSFNRKYSFKFSIPGMEMRWQVIVFIHVNNDSEKSAQLRHTKLVEFKIKDFFGDGDGMKFGAYSSLPDSQSGRTIVRFLIRPNLKGLVNQTGFNVVKLRKMACHPEPVEGYCQLQKASTSSA